MTSTIQLQLLLATFAGWVGNQQSSSISYLIEENRVLKEQLNSSGKRILFTDDQRPQMEGQCELPARDRRHTLRLIDPAPPPG